MAKYSGKPGKKSGTPLFVWVIVAVGVLAILGLGSFLGYRILRGPTGTEALPTAGEMPSLPRLELPEGPALPESADMPPLPQGPAFPQVEPSERPQLPEGPALPEAEPAPPPEPSAPSGIVYYAATVHPFTSTSPFVQPSRGYQFVTGLFRVLNKSSLQLQVDHNLMSIEYQSRIFTPGILPSALGEMDRSMPLFPTTILYPSGTAEGYVGFQIPIGATNVEPAFSPQGLPGEIEVRRVTMAELPSLAGPAPSRPVR